MKNLKDGQNMRLKTPFYPNLVRTGTLGGGSCFFHALMTSMFPSYRKSDKNKKIDIVSKTRQKISEKIDISTWKKLGGSSVAITPTFMNIRNYFEQVYKFLQKPEKLKGVNNKIKNILNKTLFKECMDHYILITEILPFYEIDNEVLPIANNACVKEDNLDKCLNSVKSVFTSFFKDKIQKVGKDELSKKKIKYFVDRFTDLSNNIIDQAVNDSFSNFCSKIKNYSEWVDNYLIEFLSDFFNIDIYFIDGNTLLPYNFGPCHYKKRKSIVILWYDRVHYESVSVIDDKRNATRTFSFDHPLIQQLYTYLCEPEKLIDKYPDLHNEIQNKKDEEGDDDAVAPRLPGRHHGRRGNQNAGDTAQGGKAHDAHIEQPGVSPLDIHAQGHHGRDQAQVQNGQGQRPALHDTDCCQGGGHGGEHQDRAQATIHLAHVDRPANMPVGRNSRTSTRMTNETANL